MADEETSTVTEAVSTPAPAEPVEETKTEPTPEVPTETPAADEPRTADDVWNSMGEGEEDEAESEPAETPEETPAEEPAKPAEEKPKEEEEEGDKSIEDQVLEEAFSDETEKPETEKEEDLDKLDATEQLERQRNATARAWAERNAKRAEIVKDYAYRDTPIADVATKLEELNPDRYNEFSQHAAHKLVDANPDATFQRAYAVKMLQKNPNWDVRSAKLPTLDDLIAGPPVTDTEQPVRSSPPAELQQVTGELDKTLGWDWRNPELDENFVDERELTMVKTIRALEAKAAEPNGLATENEELKEKLKGLSENAESTEQKEIKEALTQKVKVYRDDVEKKVLPYVAKYTGLEVNANDTPEIKAFKENRMQLFTGTEYDRANNYPSQFESFAYNESSVRNELETITERVVTAQVREVQAEKAGDTAAAHKFSQAAADEKVPMFQLLAQAAKEFKTRFIAPDLALIGKLSSKLADPIKEASERIEVVSNGSSVGAPRPQKKDYDTADDVWSGMVEDAAQEEKLRANT